MVKPTSRWIKCKICGKKIRHYEYNNHLNEFHRSLMGGLTKKLSPETTSFLNKKAMIKEVEKLFKKGRIEEDRKNYLMSLVDDPNVSIQKFKKVLNESKKSPFDIFKGKTRKDYIRTPREAYTEAKKEFGIINRFLKKKESPELKKLRERDKDQVKYMRDLKRQRETLKEKGGWKTWGKRSKIAGIRSSQRVGLLSRRTTGSFGLKKLKSKAPMIGLAWLLGALSFLIMNWPWLGTALFFLGLYFALPTETEALESAYKRLQEELDEENKKTRKKKGPHAIYIQPAPQMPQAGGSY